ncbi:PilZ domain-containing protein [Methylobacterium trifolii]|uniref:PilZ domain-containing protein n=1 Tax=Methylobacterium trifolii TaxID=1003092 RepID=UPI001EE039B1|nr:PilZ domain-containing protein [Methylobacterium trifolii]
MFERRTSERVVIKQIGSIALDEHRSASCLIYDHSEGGVRLTLPNAVDVPEVFVLSMEQSAAPRVCKVIWRKDEEVGAKFHVPSSRPSIRKA